MKKVYPNLKLLLLSGVIASAISFSGCLTAATAPNQSGSNNQGALCDLLLKAGGTATDVTTCKAAASLSDANRTKLCAADKSALTADDKALLKGSLTVEQQATCGSVASGATGNGN